MKINAAVIGTGFAGKAHCWSYGRIEATRLVAVCGRDHERVTLLANDLTVAGYTSIDEMLEKERPHVVSVATGEYDHVAPVLAALAAGSNVLCEKPLAHSLSAAEQIIAAQRHAGLTVGVNYNFRHLPVHLAIRDELTAGRFGPLALFAANTYAYLWPHMLDLIRFFLGDPVEVQGAIADEPSLRPPLSAAPSSRSWDNEEEMLYHPSVAAAAILRFRQPDAIATVSSTALSESWRRNLWSFTVYGLAGMVAIDHASLDDLTSVSPLGGLSDNLRSFPSVGIQESFDRSIEHFVTCMLDDRSPLSTAEDALASMRLDAFIVEAARTGNATPVSLGP